MHVIPRDMLWIETELLRLCCSLFLAEGECFVSGSCIIHLAILELLLRIKFSETFSTALELLLLLWPPITWVGTCHPGNQENGRPEKSSTRWMLVNSGALFTYYNCQFHKYRFIPLWASFPGKVKGEMLKHHDILGICAAFMGGKCIDITETSVSVGLNGL